MDKNPFAVSLAKLSLWLVTLARDHAFTFIDHALKHGDSLVGLTRRQIAAFDWKTKASDQIDWIAEQTRHDIEEALGWRNTLQGFGEGSYNQKTERGGKRRTRWRTPDSSATWRLPPSSGLTGTRPEGATKPVPQRCGGVAYERGEPACAGGDRRRTQELREAGAAHALGDRVSGGVRARACGIRCNRGNPPFQGGRNLSATQGKVYSRWLLAV